MTRFILPTLPQLFNLVEKVELSETGALEEASEVSELQQLCLGQETTLSVGSLEVSPGCSC